VYPAFVTERLEFHGVPELHSVMVYTLPGHM
jgi:hypothetical protein